MLKALSDPTRLRIFLFLRNCKCRCGCSVQENGDTRCNCGCGKTVGEVCCNVLGLERIPSSLSFHLKELKAAGIVRSERRGKNILCALNPEAEAALQAFFGGPDGSEETKHERKMHLRQL